MGTKVRKRLAAGGIHAVLLLSFLVMLFPVMVMLSTSFKEYEDVFSWPPEWIPAHPTFDNYRTVWFGEYQFKWPYSNSIIIASTTALITVLLAFPAAYALSRFRFFGRGVLLFAVLVTQMFSPVVLIIGLYQMMKAYDLINTLVAIIITNCAFTLPMSVWLLHGYLKNVPETLEQAASIDGCSRLGGLARVVLPLSAPGVAMSAIFAFIWAWNDLLIPLIFISQSELRPVSLALTDFVGQNIIYWNEMMAASMMTTLPVAVMFSFVQKYFVKGFVSGALKE